MIESVRDNERNNVRINVSSNTNVKLPKNIRQVGQAGASKKIYVEDYVMTFIKQMAMKKYGSYQIAVLLGKISVEDNVERIFIHGAVQLDNVDFDEGKVFTNEAWTSIYEAMKEYYEDVEIVGWYLTRPGLALDLTDTITKMHLDNFAGQNKVLLLYDSVEREEVFYLYLSGRMKKQPGYYVFYERNTAMQNYMIDHNDSVSVESEYVDDTSVEIRNVLEKRKIEKGKKRSKISFTYAAATILAVFILVATATILSRMDRSAPVSQQASNTGQQYVAEGDSQKDSTNTQVNVTQGEVNQQVDANQDGTNGVATSGGNIVGQENNTTPSDQQPQQTNPDASTTTAQANDPKITIQDTNPSGAANTQPAANDAKVHEVVKGDTLNKISMEYYNSRAYIEEIKKLNNLSDDTIYIGQKLQLP